MAERIGLFDWSTTPLGPSTRWPQSLKTIVDLMLGSPDTMSLVWGAEAIHLYNDAFAELLRGHCTSTLGQSAFDVFAWSRDVFEAHFAAGIAGRSARLLGQLYPVLRNGRLDNAWFDVDYTPIRDDTGAVAGVLWTLTETTSKHLAEQALRASEARYRLLVESWAQAVWEADPAGVVIADSPSWRAYTGQSIDEWLGYGWLNAIHPDDRAHAERQWRAAVTAQGHVDAEFRIRASDGNWRWTNVRAAPVLDAGGRVERWAGMNIDIDVRKHAEEALRANEEVLATDLANAERLRSLSERLVSEESFEAIYDEVLSTTVAIAQADAGTIQDYNPDTKTLELITSLNFSRTITDHFHRVDTGNRTACAVALSVRPIRV